MLLNKIIYVEYDTYSQQIIERNFKTDLVGVPLDKDLEKYLTYILPDGSEYHKRYIYTGNAMYYVVPFKYHPQQIYKLRYKVGYTGDLPTQ